MIARCRRGGFSLIELLVVVSIIALLSALVLPAIQKVRAAADRMICASNMRQLGIALHHFHLDHNRFPPSGFTTASSMNPAGKFVGWRALILPYIEQDNVRKLYSTKVHWWEEPNLTLAGTPVKIFLCPSTPDRADVTSAVAKPPRPAITFTVPAAATDYEALMGVQPSVDPVRYATASSNRSVLYRNSRTQLPKIYDGTSTTIMVVECTARPLVYRGRTLRGDLSNDQGQCWADSEGDFSLDGANEDGSLQGLGPILTPRAINATNENESYSFHPFGANFLFADGHVSFLSDQIGLLEFAALVTRNAGEVAIEP